MDTLDIPKTNGLIPARTENAAKGNGVTRLAARVWGWSLWIGLVCVALLWIPSPLTFVGLVGAVLLFGCRWAALGRPFPRTRVNIPLLVFLAALAVAFALTRTPQPGWVLVAQAIAGITLLFVLYDRIETATEAWWLAAGIVCFGGILALAAPFSVDWRVPRVFDLPLIYAREYPRLFESTVPNVLAGALAPLVPLALSLLFAPQSRMRLIGAVMLAPIAIILLLLQSRGALFGVGIGLVVWVCLQNRWLIPIVPVAALALLLVYRQLGGEPPVSFLYGPVGADLTETVGERETLTKQGLALLAQNPVFGIGLGTYQSLSRILPPFSPLEPGPSNPHVHNVLLQVGLDLGIVGLAGFAAVIGLAIYAAWRGYRARVARPLAIGVLAAFVVLLVHGLGDSTVWGFKASIILWLLCASALVFDKIAVEL